MEISQYFKGIKTWWWLIFLCTTLAAAASYLASVQQPRIYKTTTTLLVGQVTQKTEISGGDFALAEQLAESYAQMTSRQPVLQGTVESLGLELSWQDLKSRVYAYSIPRTQLLAIDVQDISPQRAVAIADKVAYQLILQSPTSPKNQRRQERGEFIRDQLDELERRIQTAQDRITEQKAELETALSARQIANLQAEITSLENSINDWQTNYNDLLSFLDGGDTPNQLTVIEPAQLPTAPISPNISMNVMLAAAVGFSLAVGAALLLEYIDNTVKTADDFGTLSTPLANLGVIRHIEGLDYKDKLVSMQDLFSPVTEAYRQIRTNLQYTAVDQPAKTVMVTSASAGEGKTTTAANLAIVMAQAELKTIIVDADLRKPTLHHIFQISNLTGLTDLLSSNHAEFGDQVKETGIENLRVITSGALPPNPSEILGSQRMMKLLQNLKENADVIILDVPPVLAVTDPIVMSTKVDGVVFITKANRTRRDSINQAKQRLDQVGAKILGAVLNEASGKASHYHQYYSRSQQQQASHLSGAAALRRWWQRLLFVSK